MGKYVIELISHVAPADPLIWSFFADRVDEPFHTPPGVTGNTHLFDFKGYRFHAWEQIGLPWRAKEAGIQVLHCTATTLPYWQPVPTIVTIHDTLPWHESGLGLYEHWYLHKLIPAAYRKCAAIITISESSKRDILGLWPWLKEKLHVIPHGVADKYFDVLNHHNVTPLQGLIGNEPYFLYIGGALARKRFSWAVEIFQNIDTERTRLVACGFNEQERNVARAALMPSIRDRVIFLPFVSEEEMPYLYQQAVAVLYPTLYEGFGFPALEAQAVGSPVLLSDLSSLSELKGPSAEILPVEDFNLWVQTCRRLLALRSRSPKPNEQARTWARKYSWLVSASRHLDLYKTVANTS
jgi:glycosyltransferase involved in cell wall biosynthesis